MRGLSQEHFDVAVIGGGINGVAIARECARAGKRVLIVEQNDFGSGTTSRSTRIIHGGLRYLEHGELGLVRESLREREQLLCRHPHLVRPLKFLLALRHGGRHSALAIRAGLWMYRALAGRPAPSSSAERVRKVERMLDEHERWAMFEYDDAQCEFPERLVAEWLAEATGDGAIAINHCRVLEVARSRGRVTGLRLRDQLRGQESSISATWVINAAGPWVDQVCAAAEVRAGKPLIGGVRGSHIVVSSYEGAPDTAVYSEAVDGRPIFVIPWNGQLLVGTTEVADSGDPGATAPTEREVRYLADSLRHTFPGAATAWAEIRYAFAGVRPLPYSPGAPMASVTRRHRLHDHTADGLAGMISVIGGKLTTAVGLAREVAHKVGSAVAEPQPLLVAAAPLDGIEAALCQWARQVSCIAKVPETSALAIAQWHGRRALCIARLAASDAVMREPLCPHSPHLAAEAVEAVRYECAVTLGDVLLRRVPVALSGCWSDDCTRQAAARIGAALGWSSAQIERSAEEFEVERNAFLGKPRPLPAATGQHAA